jgi:hypothetical protein
VADGGMVSSGTWDKFRSSNITSWQKSLSYEVVPYDIKPRDLGGMRQWKK